MKRRTKRILRPLIGIGVCLLVGAPFVWRGTPNGSSSDARAAAGPETRPGVPGAVAATAPEAAFARPPETGPDPRRDVTRDPAAAQSIAAALAADPPVRATPGPYVKLTIPEPDEAERAVVVRTGVPDADAP